jgi:hypothetical protein
LFFFLTTFFFVFFFFVSYHSNAGTTTTTTSGGKTNGAAIAFAVIGWLGLVGVAVGAAWWYFTKRLPAQRLKEEQFQLGVA